ncbi:MAG: hypothetical protein WBD40_07775 [Tepidisphaeraceae bacterium]
MAVFSHSCGGGDDEEARKKHLEAMRETFSPAQVEQVIGQAISICWMMLPPEKKNVANVVVEMRRIFERSIKNLEDDAAAFGVSS